MKQNKQLASEFRWLRRETGLKGIELVNAVLADGDQFGLVQRALERRDAHQRPGCRCRKASPFNHFKWFEGRELTRPERG